MMWVKSWQTPCRLAKASAAGVSTSVASGSKRMSLKSARLTALAASRPSWSHSSRSGHNPRWPGQAASGGSSREMMRRSWAGLRCFLTSASNPSSLGERSRVGGVNSGQPAPEDAGTNRRAPPDRLSRQRGFQRNRCYPRAPAVAAEGRAMLQSRAAAGHAAGHDAQLLAPAGCGIAKGVVMRRRMS